MTAIHKATPEDAPRILPLMASFHAEEGTEADDAHRHNALMPLLDGSHLGEVFIIGPRIAPIGYVVITYGWSIEFGGKDAFVDEVYLRPKVRGRGLGSEVLLAVGRYLAEAQITAVHLEVDHDNTTAIAMYEKTGFQMRGRYGLMTRRLT
ncbi:GNAT family N-acetyltransferase [Shimia ponticola]|uniref:GNAT family N-acetyltransferase n=1 Tax=Shimia ponticola TaxID=2582893 RepID=UPI0011BE2B9B|nr:GNAT family N-acetyltransferase [Shimia ponticola]